MLCFLPRSNPHLLDAGPRQGGATYTSGCTYLLLWTPRRRGCPQRPGSGGGTWEHQPPVPGRKQVGSRSTYGTGSWQHGVSPCPSPVRREKCNSSLWKSSPSAMEAPRYPSPPLLHGFEEVTVGAWEVEFWHAGVGFLIWWLHSLSTLTSYRWCGMRCDPAPAADPVKAALSYCRWRCIWHTSKYSSLQAALCQVPSLWHKQVYAPGQCQRWSIHPAPTPLKKQTHLRLPVTVLPGTCWAAEEDSPINQPS